ncbi:hypothetical protein CYMTET_40091 [Cymbomonas tetramitiformis]|uniref:Uncharacterized protein n=1 Tax=Cymbomonas tetramitiformis TaxID=36881 RepID=A0AAE0C8R0_9CHLO|nr:hypothetical protein CYMTET_40091 [Cymbomonas tetramitiformis]
MPKLPPKPSKGTLTDKHGSFQINKIREPKAAKKATEATASEEIELRGLARDLAREQREKSAADLVAQKQLEAQQLQDAWEKCTPTCTCPLVFVGLARVGACPIAGLKKCRVCNDIKKSKCAKAACRNVHLRTFKLLEPHSVYLS